MRANKCVNGIKWSDEYADMKKMKRIKAKIWHMNVDKRKTVNVENMKMC